MKIFFTVILLITFHFASAQNDTSATLKSLGDSVLFTDFKPVYTAKASNWPSHFTIDKIEYTQDEMILYLGLSTNEKEIGFVIFGKKSESGMVLTSKIGKEKIIHMHNIKNIRLNGELYSAVIPDDKYLDIIVKQGDKFTMEIYFPRLPKEIKTVNLVNGPYVIEPPLNYIDIQIKSTGDVINDKKEKDLLNKMELNKPLTLNNIYFETGKSDLLDSSFAELNTLFNILKNKPKMIIQISGYTDNVGKAQDNIILSEARANAVKKYLSDKGIDKSRIVAKGYGSSNPKASNDTEEGRAKNRRVEIIVLKNE